MDQAKRAGDGPGCRGKDRGAVPLGAGRADQRLAGLDLLSRLDQGGAALDLHRRDQAAGPGTDGLQLARKDGGGRLGGGRLHFQPPAKKVDAGPGKFPALEQRVFSGVEVLLGHPCAGSQARVFPQKSSRPRLLAGGHVRVEHRPDQAPAPQQQGKKDGQPHPQAGAPEQRPQPEKQAPPLLDLQPHPALPGQLCQTPVAPGRAAPVKPAGPRDDGGKLEPRAGCIVEKGLGMAAAGGKRHPGPELYSLHPSASLVSAASVRKVRPHKTPLQRDPVGAQREDLHPVPIDGKGAAVQVEAEFVLVIGTDLLEMFDLHLGTCHVDGWPAVHSGGRLAEQQLEPAARRQPAFALFRHLFPLPSAVRRARDAAGMVRRFCPYIWKQGGCLCIAAVFSF